MKGLVLIYALTLLATVGSLRWPVVGLFTYVGFAVLRPEFIWGWAGDLSGISLAVGIATLIGWAFRGFGSLQVGKGRIIVAALLGFAVWSSLSALQAKDPDVAYVSLVAMAKFVMPFLIGVTLLDSEKQARGMLWTIVLAQGYVALEMNLNYLQGYNAASVGFGGMDNNCFGVSLVATIGPAIALGLVAKRWYEKVLAGAASALILHTTLLTFSRGAMVGVLAVGVSAFLIMPKRPKYLAVLALAGLLSLRFTGPELAARYASAFADADERDYSAESRVDLWLDCLKIVGDQPFFGVGPMNFPVVASSLGWIEGKEAHSVWMQTAAETGVPGVMALMFFYVFAVVKLWPIARAKPTDENRYEKGLAMGVIMSIVGFAVAGQFVSLVGLEIPYYTTMAGVVLLKASAARTAAAAAAKPFAGHPTYAVAARGPLSPVTLGRPVFPKR